MLSNPKNYSYPLSARLMAVLFEKYRQKAEKKGDSWKTAMSIEGYDPAFWLAKFKLAEEYDEVKKELERAGGRLGLEDTNLQAELEDIMLVAAMIWERLESSK